MQKYTTSANQDLTWLFNVFGMCLLMSNFIYVHMWVRDFVFFMQSIFLSLYE